MYLHIAKYPVRGSLTRLIVTAVNPVLVLVSNSISLTLKLYELGQVP